MTTGSSPLEGGREAVAAMIADAEEPRGFLARVAGADPVPGGSFLGRQPGDWNPDEDELGLPPECPVIPLGVDGDVYWFLDTLGQLRPLEFSKFGQKAIGSLFMGRHWYLYWAWPRKSEAGNVLSWRQEKASETLMAACARKGPWNAVERARGRGAWRLADGTLAVHCGTHLWVDGQEMALGEVDGDVYMTRPPIHQPWKRPLTGQKNGPATELLPMLRTWNWARPNVDPVLLLGWIGAGFLGGALPWRPVIYMTGDKATGKSTLQKLIKAVFGPALIQSADATAAGIYQLLKADGLPVAIDELEGKADTRRQKAVMELARASADNNLVLRGGESHKGVQFYARSCFAFSSINTPPLDPQDWSRIALLQLYKLKKGAIEPTLDDQKLGKVGRMVLRRMIDQWSRFPTTFQAYREALSAAGHDARGQNTFGVLLACADLIVGEDGEALDLPMGSFAEDLSWWSEQLRTETLWEYENATENWRLCLNHVLSSPVAAWRQGGPATVGEVNEKYERGAAGRADGYDINEAVTRLQQAGLSLLPPTQEHPQSALFVPNQHQLLHGLFQGSKWAGEPGAGVWAGALRQSPQEHWRLGNQRVTGVKVRGTLFPLDVVMGRRSEDDAA